MNANGVVQHSPGSRERTLGKPFSMEKRGRPKLDPAGGPSKFLTIRTAEGEQDAYRQAAERAGVPLSAWVRERLNKAAKRESKRD